MVLGWASVVLPHFCVGGWWVVLVCVCGGGPCIVWCGVGSPCIVVCGWSLHCGVCVVLSVDTGQEVEKTYTSLCVET